MQQQQRRSSSSSANKPAVPPKPKLTLTDTTSKLFMSSQAFLASDTFIFNTGTKPKTHHSSTMALEMSNAESPRQVTVVDLPKPITSASKCRSLKIDTDIDQMKSSCRQLYHSDEHSTSSSSSSSSSFDNKEMVVDPIARISERVCSFEDKSLHLLKQMNEQLKASIDAHRSASSSDEGAADNMSGGEKMGITGSLLDEIYAEIEDKQVKSCLVSSGSNHVSSLSSSSANSSEKSSPSAEMANKPAAVQSQFCTSPFCSTSSYTSSNSCSCSSSSSSYSNAYSATYMSNTSAAPSSPPPLPSVPPPPLETKTPAVTSSSTTNTMMRSRRKQQSANSSHHSKTPSKKTSTGSKSQVVDLDTADPLDLLLPKNTLSLEEEIQLEINRNKLTENKIDLFSGQRKNENENNTNTTNNYELEENFNDQDDEFDEDGCGGDEDEEEEEEETDYLEPIILTQGLSAAGHHESSSLSSFNVKGCKKTSLSLRQDDTNSVQTVDYNDDNLSSNFKLMAKGAAASTAAVVDSDQQSSKSSSLKQGNEQPRQRNARIHSINNYAELFSLSPSKLKSYILNHHHQHQSSKSSKSPSTLSNSSKMSQQSQVAPPPSASSSSSTTPAASHQHHQSAGKSSLNYILKTSSKLTSTLRLIRTRSLTQANTLNALINSNCNLPPHQQPSMAHHEALSSPMNSPSLSGKRSVHPTGGASSSAAMQISQPTLISQTFDLSKQNLIELKQTPHGSVSPINYENLNEITPVPVASLSVNCSTLSRHLKKHASSVDHPPTIVSNTIITNVYEEDGN